MNISLRTSLINFRTNYFAIPFSLLLAISFLILCLVSKAQTAENHNKQEYDVAAYVWPSCHDDPLARRKLWPEGIGEWEVIKKGTPRFPGHYQPRQPLWGYEMDNDPRVVERWIDAAVDHGVNIFVYDWYWYENGPFLESALNDGFLKAKNNNKMRFYIMWANHDVKHNYWNYHLYGDDASILFNAKVDWKNYKIIVERVINKYFKRPNYYKINGEPVFSIFSIEKLLESFDGSITEARKALDYFRAETVKAGFPGLHIQWNQGGGNIMSRKQAENFRDKVDSMGFNSVAMYNMGGMREDYIVYGTNSIKIREQMDSILKVPVFPCVSIGWDDTPRFPGKGMKDVVHYNNTPTSFAALLERAKRYVDNHPEQPRLITINAWNEWVEGSYLLPDMKNGFEYLKAVKNVMTGSFDPYFKAEETKNWEVLFNGKDVSKWKGLNGDSFPSDIWKVDNGSLFVDGQKKGGDIITRETFKNFELDFKFKLTRSANSGIKYLVNNIRNNESGKMVWNGPEYQIIDDFNNPDVEGDSGSTASFYLVYAPDKAKHLNPAGEWNQGKIIVNGNHIEHWLNGVKVVSCERGSEDYRQRIGRTKFKAYSRYGETETGHIMLTDHGGDKVYFKEIRIKRL